MYHQHNQFGQFKAEELSVGELSAIVPSCGERGSAPGLSARYKHVTTLDVVERLGQNGWAPVRAQSQRFRDQARAPFVKHMIAFRLRDQIQSLDEYNVELLLSNSHDGKASYTLRAGIWRRICSNGLVVADSTFEALRYPHVGFDCGDVVRASDELASALPMLTDRIDLYRDRSMSWSEQSAFASAAIKLRWDDPPITVDDALVAFRYEDEGTSLWRVMNRVQENLEHGGIEYSRTVKRGDQERTVCGRTRRLKAIDAKVRFNVGLWQLADQVLSGTFNAN